MAFLVCFSRVPPADHALHRAIYLDQQFYELIFSQCRSDSAPYTVLREMSCMRYKSPTMVVAGSRPALLDQDLVRLAQSGASHPQIGELRDVCAKAMSEQLVLTISGDMYPELG